MSENSDAVVVVLSEETGQLSIAIGGKLRRFDTVTEFTSELMQVLLPSSNDEQTSGNKLSFIAGVKKKLIRKSGGSKAGGGNSAGEISADEPVELHEEPTDKKR